MEPKPSKAIRPWISWPAALIVVVAVLAGAGLYVFKSLRDLPGDVAERGQEVLEDVRRIAQAFTTGTVKTSFISYATKASGSNYLQFAKLEEVEVFRRQDSASTLWGQLDLPDVVVEATAPVEYTYYLDLDGTWDFRLEGANIWVTAPAIEFNQPAIDASAIRYEVREESLFRDEEEAIVKLRRGITVMARQRARENIELIRELGRRKTAEFVEKWVVQNFTDGGSHRVSVRFADEGSPVLEEEEEVENR